MSKDLYKDFLLNMKSHPFYSGFKRELLKARPDAPPHNPDEDNTEQWKALSAQQRGFDLCCQFLMLEEE